METALSICLAAFCFGIYLPVMLNAVRQISNGEVVIRRASLDDPYPRRYSGASATVYSVMQAIAAAIALVGASIGLTQGNINPFFLGLAASIIVGYGGVYLANQLGYERVNPEEQIANMFQSILGGMNINMWTTNTATDDPEVMVYGPDDAPTGEDRPRQTSSLPHRPNNLSRVDIEDADFEDITPDDDGH